MTVQDLIDELKRHDPHLPVLIGKLEIEYVLRGTFHFGDDYDKSCVQLLTHRPMNNPCLKKADPQVA